MGGRSLCSKMMQFTFPYTYYRAICNQWIYGDPWAENPCPKGWGKNKDRYPNDRYSVLNAQGFYKNGNPIYSTVTKYRDTVYNYTAGRIAKA